MNDSKRLFEDLGIIPNIHTPLVNNENLLQGVNFMEDKRDDLRSVDYKYLNEGYSNMEKEQIVKQIQEPKKVKEKQQQHTKLKEQEKEQIHLSAMKNDSIIQIKSIKLHYLAWLIFFLFIVWAILYITSFSYENDIKNDYNFVPTLNNTNNIISVIIIIILLLSIVILYNKYNSSHLKTIIRVYENKK